MAGRVPNLSLDDFAIAVDDFAIDVQALSGELNPHGGFGLKIELVPGEPAPQVG